MSIQSVLLPVFVQVLLTFVIFILMAKERSALMRKGDVRWQEIALRQSKWPEPVQRFGDCLENQFEAPVLFYLLAVLAIITKAADLAFVVMAWAFVLTRIAHATVFVTSNYVPLRGLLFIVGLVDLLLMWALFAYRILL
ncbi:MAPEG family protein [Methylocapsa palsarum]|uniref:MAPEG family protein n=1 Tax=Methylocapsa palsarum TaxID=1612308 RepID=A0A1I3XVY7_9HYPH|nr:MAPEG family protein [Methylocapsa palsarum]SFK23807.1 hypothetical protein SAMN05444581_104132 [Methylocapsa palsarum]